MDAPVDLSSLFGNAQDKEPDTPSFAKSLESTGGGVKDSTSTTKENKDKKKTTSDLATTMDWNSLIKDVGNAQNLSFCTSQLAGNPLANTLAASASKSLSSGASELGSSIGNPFVGSAVGALAGASVAKATTDSTLSAITKVTSKLDLQPAQKLIGQGLSTLNNTNKTFGFLYPAAEDHKTTCVVQLDKSLASDGNITYKSVPVIPTLIHHGVRWLDAIPGEKPITSIKNSQALASRMSITLPDRGLAMSLLVNPKNLNINRTQTMSSAVSRSGHIVNPTGPGEFDVTVIGTTAAFYESVKTESGQTGGLTFRETYSVGYSNLVMLYNFFLNNGYFLDDEASLVSRSNGTTNTLLGAPQASLETPPTHRINSMGYVSLEWQKWLWNGFFKSFKITDSAESPYTLNFEFVFHVCQEADRFSIDNTKYDKDLNSNATGHVVDGFSSERALAVQVTSASEGGASSIAPVHRNVSPLYSFEDVSDPVTTSLNPTVPLDEVTRRLSLGGYNLTTLTGPGGTRVFGTSADGTSLDLNGKDSSRALTMVTPGSSPVKYLSVAEQDTSQTVKGTVKIEPCGDTYTYKNVPGSIAN